MLSVRGVYDWKKQTSTSDEAEDEALLVGTEPRSADIHSTKWRGPSLLVQALTIMWTRLLLYR